MIKYIIRKALGWILMIFLATNITYFLANNFLDPASNYQERRPQPSPEQIASMLEPYNLGANIPLFEKWWTWLTGILLRWDWGQSPLGQDVNTEISYRIWTSAQLVLGATIISTLLGVGLGVFTAARQYKLADRFWQGVGIITMNIPIVVAAFMIVSAAIWFNQSTGQQWFYVTGSGTPGLSGIDAFVNMLQHLILPTTALVLTGYAGTHFTQRSLLLDNINADYVRTARAKGVPKALAIRRHALRTSLIPVATGVAFAIPNVFTGALLTERIFAWRGMGDYFTITLGRSDIHGVVAVAAFGALMTAIGAILADIVVVALDPRVRVN
ncbi:ABC transporter permease [Parenemella sanctibonifatiensis]|uniref:ABC transporter permease n=1 Tax=Parenemella sanctibonifatiensis TaxID=2016505 RepID=A0A255EFZ4_9ACTN|nr:ABC transporter permease [Parenemella sanctibonifatiensis]OYN90454.1 ABC transporter permease [Parenemella sanctibonifatiensis]